MGQMIGIDLGTTNTAVCAIVGGRPQMIKNKKGYTVFPSAVFIDSNGKVIVGRRAKTAMMTEPERGVFAVKRLLGRRFDSEEVTQIRKQVPYSIKGAPDGSCLVEMAGEWYSPVDIASFILKEARTIAEAETGESVDQAVITVPAYYNHSQRDATKQAAAKAGLNCERIINEPTSAALAYGERKTGERIVLIFDLGGGTFDVSILHFSEGLVETLATKGDTFLGGEDFDERLVDLLADQFFNDHNRDPREDPVSRRRLKETAESAKCELSFRDKTSVLVPRLVGTTNLEHTLTRGDFEQIVDDLIQRAIQVTSEAVADAGLRLQDINDLVLVGGQTRMPLIRQRISALLEIEPIYGVNPEEVVATGACVHGFSLVSENNNAPVLMDVTPFDLGVDIRGGFFEKIITRNTHVPTMETKSFSTGRVGQDTVRVVVRQGESRYAADNEFLGEFIMNNLMPNEMGVASVDVTLRLDANGMLHVSAVDPSTGERRNITARNYGQFVEDRNIKLDVETETIQGKRPQQSADASDNARGLESRDSTDEGKKGKAKGGFFSRLFGKGKKEAPQDISLSKAETSEPQIDDLSNALDTLDLDALLPVGTEQDGQENKTDDSLFDELGGTDIQELDASALFDLDESELRDLGDEDLDESTSKVAAFGMGDSSSAAQQSASNETRSDVQFTDQDDTQILDAFNEDATVESLLFDGLENTSQTTGDVPNPILGEQDDEIDSILSSILDEPDEGETQLMDRSSVIDAVQGDDDDLERLLSELEKDVAESTSSNPNAEDNEKEDVADVLDELDIDFDFEDSDKGTKSDSESMEDIEINEVLSQFDEIEEPQNTDSGLTIGEELSVPDIDDLLAELEIDIESNLDNEPEPENTGSDELDDVDSILAGDDDIDIDAFLQSLDIVESVTSDESDEKQRSETDDVSQQEPELDIVIEEDVALDVEDVVLDIQKEESLVRETESLAPLGGGQVETVEPFDEPETSPEESPSPGPTDLENPDGENTESKLQTDIENNSPNSEDQVVAEAAAVTDSKNVFESLPDDGFFSMYSDGNEESDKKSGSVSSDEPDIDDALEIPTSVEEDFDSLDDLFDD